MNWGLKKSLIRDRVMFGLQNNFVSETLPSDLKLTLQTAIEKVRLVELTYTELPPIRADQEVAEETCC